MSAIPHASRLAVLVFTDIVGSTELKTRIGTTAYARLLERHDDIFKQLIALVASAEILNDTGDGYFAAFSTVSDAVRFALKFQQALHDEPWHPQPIRTRIGIHVGEVAEIGDRENGKPKIVGIAADLASRIAQLGQAGQILLTRVAFNDARQFIGAFADESADHAHARPLKWVAHGAYLIKGYEDGVEIFEVGVEGVAPLAPPIDNEDSRRSVSAEQEETLGWRPAMGLTVPQRVQWVLERKLGEGTFGEVWLARHEATKQFRVFKFCFDAERLRSFKRELTLFRLLQDALGERRDIATIFDVRLDRPPFFLEGEFAPSGNLADWSAEDGLGKLPLSARLEIVARVADAVAAAHSVGVLHKDIKPSNILMHVEPDGTLQPRLSDFGIGILTDRTQLAAHHITEMGFTLLGDNESSRTGTRMYAPPESLTGKPFTTQGDIYALGVLLYQMAIADLNRPVALGWERDIPDELLREDLASCLEGEPTRRVQSAAEVATRIRTLDRRRAQRQAEREQAEAARRRQRRVRIFSAAAGLFAVLAALAVVGFVRERDLRQRAEKSERETAVAYAVGAVDQGKALHLVGRGQESREAFVRARDQFARLGESTLAADVGLFRSFREFDAPINTLAGHADGVMSVAWLPDSLRAVSASEDGTVRLWDARTGRELRCFTLEKPALAAAVSPDGKYILAGGAGAAKTVCLFDIDSGNAIWMVAQPNADVRGVAFSPDGKLAAVVSANAPSTIGLLEIPGGKTVVTLPAPPEQRFYAVAFSPDGKQLLTTTYEKEIHLWNIAAAKIEKTFAGHDGYVVAAAFGPDGRFVSASFDQTLKLWDPQNSAASRTFTGHGAGARGVAVSRDGKAILSCGMDGALKLWNVDTGQNIRTFAGHVGGVRALAISPDRKRAISGGADGTLRVWDLGPNREAPTTRQSAVISAIGAASDGLTFVTGALDGSVRLCDAATLRTLQTYAGHTRPIDFVAICADGQRVFAADGAGRARLWDLATARELRSYPPRAAETIVDSRGRRWCYTALLADARHALSTRPDRTLELWNLDTGSAVRAFEPAPSDLTAIAVAPDQRHVFTGEISGDVACWNLDTGRREFSFPAAAKQGDVDALAFSADGETLLVGGHELNVHLFDLRTRSEVRSFTGHTLVVEAVGLSPDGQTIVSAGRDKTLRLWNARTGEPLDWGATFDAWIYSLAVLPAGNGVITAAGPTVGRWDFHRAVRQLDFEPRLSAAGAKLRANASDAVALAQLAEWYAFRGADDWAAALLEQSRAAGGEFSSLLLARCYWQLNRPLEAAREFRRAIERNEAPSDYLGLCIAATGTGATSSPAPTSAPPAPSPP